MEEHKALKYHEYRDKLYIIIETENVDDTHILNYKSLKVACIHTSIIYIHIYIYLFIYLYPEVTHHSNFLTLYMLQCYIFL